MATIYECLYINFVFLLISFFLRYEEHLDLEKLLHTTKQCLEFVYIPKNYIINSKLAEQMDRVYPEGIETISEGLEYWHPDESATHGNIIATFFFFFFFCKKI